MNDEIMGGVFLALVFFSWLAWMVSKVAIQVFQDLERMFDAIGSAAASFLGMAWTMTELAAVIAAGIAVVYAAIKYYEFVTKSLEVLERVDALCQELSESVEKKQEELETRVNKDMEHLRDALREALRAPEIVPEEPKALPAPEEIIVLESAMESATTTPRVSNPY